MNNQVNFSYEISNDHTTAAKVRSYMNRQLLKANTIRSKETTTTFYLLAPNANSVTVTTLFDGTCRIVIGDQVFESVTLVQAKKIVINHFNLS